MVVCLVFEEEKPILILSVYSNGNFHRAGVDFLGFIEFIKATFLLEDLCRDRSDVHEVLGLCSADGFSRVYIIFVSLFEKLVLEAYAVYSRVKCCVSAMV